MTRRRALGLGIACAILAPIVALLLTAAWMPLPVELSVVDRSPSSIRVVDRGGRLIRELRTADHQLTSRVSVDEVFPWVVPALIAAEDRRFWSHPGVDVIAVVRAGAQMLWQRRIVSGASTLTQQLARTLVARPRTLGGKFREMALALRIEASLDKKRILEEYLSRVEFGPNLRGIQAASQSYFDKPASQLELGEAALLAAMPRGPSLYDPTRGLERIERRRARVLDRMQAAGLAGREALETARSLPIRLYRPFAEGGSEHFVTALALGALEPALRGEVGIERIESTLDSRLQRETEVLAGASRGVLESFGASAVAAVVMDNASGEVLAYLGSADFSSEQALGQNDGVRALRQPGSTLKPFLYALALRELGLTPASLLPDVELSFPTPEGPYTPHNYDQRYHGPVRLRAALANSLNVPAVHTASKLGPERLLGFLRRLGFRSLDRPAQHYGVALALGDGEVRLLELVQAYAALARGGTLQKARFARGASFRDGRKLVLEPAPPERVVDPELCALVTHMLADDRARAAAFGRESALNFPFPVAAKTGTSKGFRDNWVLGYTREVTVGVWVGNFDGHPMKGSTGISGAGPLFHEIMLAAMRGRVPQPLVDERSLAAVEVCALSGQLPTADCPEKTREVFAPGTLPAHSCDMHERRRDCGVGEDRVFERYPLEFASWAQAAERPTCGGSAEKAGPRVLFPEDGARFKLNADYRAQEIVLSAQSDASSMRFIVDGRAVATSRPPFRVAWPLAAGAHSLIVETSSGRRSEPVHFVVSGD